jgi:hypothetical protein
MSSVPASTTKLLRDKMAKPKEEEYYNSCVCLKMAKTDREAIEDIAQRSK